jgi:predicted enzyme related to lactoylglutathione lyase
LFEDGQGVINGRLSMKQYLFFTVALCAFASVPTSVTPAAAQDQAAQPTVALEETVVTSRSREESLLVQGLGWVVRRTAISPIEAAKFYETAFGMRPVRPPPIGVPPNKMLWTGDIVMFELSMWTETAAGKARIGDLTPVLRARDYDAAKAMIIAAGASLIEESPDDPRFARFNDPLGYPFAITEPPADSPYPSDRFADEIWRKGGIELPDIPKFGPALQDVASLILKVEDPIAMAAFYTSALGLDLVAPAAKDGAVLALGRTATLVLRPGGTRRAAPHDRAEIPDVWILRVRDGDAMVARIKASGAVIVNQLNIPGGKLTYALDPEGHLFGFQQRSPDLVPEGSKERVEDLVARNLP